MAKFSDRYGYTKPEKLIQREQLSEELRIAIWNQLKQNLWDYWVPADMTGFQPHVGIRIEQMLVRLWRDFFGKDLDALPSFYAQSRYNAGAYDMLKDYVLKAPWYGVLNFIEFMLHDQAMVIGTDARNGLNTVLERSGAVYRIVGNDVVEMTDWNEIRAVEEALKLPEDAVREHINRALELLSERPTADYRNSIKESISSVETACRLLTGNPKATLGDALNKVDGLHPALKKSFSALYGYTNDASGVRHSLMDESKLVYEDAKFMLVACAAFVSYLNQMPKRP